MQGILQNPPTPSGAPSEALPKVRSDLRFHEEGAMPMVYDPLLHRYLRLDAVSLAVLKALAESAPGVESKAALAGQAAALSGQNISVASLDAVLQLAAKNGLLQARQDQAWKASAEAAERQQEKGWKWLLHNYISFRVPLLQPEKGLDRADGILRLVFSKPVAVIMALLGLIALYLLSRQWTEFSLALRGLTEAPMILGLGATILVVKLWHETGHGHFARRYGCRVPSAGMLFILGTPLFYTDVTDAWRLKERRQRMMIAAAGVMAEAMLAIVALLLWAFLQDGLVRTIAFFVATGSLITSLLINLSPFMRFDGYFLLSDALRIPNLHDRAFESMKWHLRRFILGLADPLPTQLHGLRYGWLALFGVATAIYRLVLFMGIAVFVYHAFFKLAGLFLFAIEIAWFILKPLGKELSVWKERRKDIRWFGAGGRSILVASFVLLLLFLPLSRTINLKAVLEPAELVRAHALTPAIIDSIHVRQGQKVNAGDLLVTLVSPQLLHQKTMADMRLALIQARLARVAADPSERGQLNVLQEEERSLKVQSEGLVSEISALSIRSPVSGMVLEMDRDLHPGRTVTMRDRLVLIGSEKGLSARGMASAESIGRLSAPASAHFVAEYPLAARSAMTLHHIAAAPASIVEPMALTASLGGDIPSTPDRNGRQVASIAAYHLVLNADGTPPVQAIRGTLHISAAPESFALRALKRAASVIIRESGT